VRRRKVLGVRQKRIQVPAPQPSARSKQQSRFFRVANVLDEPTATGRLAGSVKVHVRVGKPGNERIASAVENGYDNGGVAPEWRTRRFDNCNMRVRNGSRTRPGPSAKKVEAFCLRRMSGEAPVPGLGRSMATIID
jgi:hypothetical protein